MHYDRVMIERPIDELKKEVYWFYFWDREVKLVLDRYAVHERLSKRHKWRVKVMYSRLDNRGKPMEAGDVPITGTLLAEAKAKFLTNLSDELEVVADYRAT